METPDRNSLAEGFVWRGLYRIAGYASLTMVAFIPIQIAVFVIWPLPDTVVGWFDLFQSNKIIGLLDMDFLLMVDQIFVGLILVALYAALRQTSLSMITVSLMLGLSGMVIYFASTVAFEMLFLSGRYAAATSAAEKDGLLAVGQVLLARWQGTAFNFSYIMEGISFLIIGLVMLRSSVFSNLTAWFGIALGVLSLVPPTVPVVGMYFAFLSLVPLVVWDVLIARRFFRLAKET